MSTDLQLLHELEGAGAITPTSLTLPEGTPYPKIEALFFYFGKVSHALRFYVGDLICWGEGRYGDKVYDAAEATGLTPGTLQNYASVCGRVAPDRRREGLSFAVHAEVASLVPEQQERWLGLAEENRWTVKHLRELLRDEGLTSAGPQPQWALSEKTAATADGAPAGLPVPLAAQGGEVASAGSVSPPALMSAVVEAPHVAVLATMRDELERTINELSLANGSAFSYEQRRDALNWALERLAPEMA